MPTETHPTRYKRYTPPVPEKELKAYESGFVRKRPEESSQGLGLGEGLGEGLGLGSGPVELSQDHATEPEPSNPKSDSNPSVNENQNGKNKNANQNLTALEVRAQSFVLNAILAGEDFYSPELRSKIKEWASSSRLVYSECEIDDAIEKGARRCLDSPTVQDAAAKSARKSRAKSVPSY